MIEVELDRGTGWPDAEDWQTLSTKAVLAALARTPHGDLIGSQVRTLNATYRGKDKPTNVLSFPMVQVDLLDGLDIGDDGEVLLGDIVLADGVCATEAAERDVPLKTHATHLIVHGTLHLLGYDHIDDAEAEAMEAIEREALASLGIEDPYVVDET
jgi:probable rRNA maturation factor